MGPPGASFDPNDLPPGVMESNRFQLNLPAGAPAISPALPGPLAPTFGAPAQLPAGVAPPGLPAPYPEGANAVDLVALRPRPPPPAILPMPPPPPREEENAFVRSVRLIYLDRVTREHQRLELIEQPDTEKEVPLVAMALAATIPFVAASCIVVVGVFMVIMYGLKFSPDSEELWIYASAIGMLTISGLMDVVRIAVITIVELRKFEIRRRTRAGDILERRVKKPNESELQGILKPKPKRKLLPTAPIPPPAKYPDKPNRPAFLPAVTGGGALPPPPSTPPLGGSQTNGARLPIGPGPPPGPPGASPPATPPPTVPPAPLHTPGRAPPIPPPPPATPGTPGRGGTPGGTPRSARLPPAAVRGASPSGSLRSVQDLSGGLSE